MNNKSSNNDSYADSWDKYWMENTSQQSHVMGSQQEKRLFDFWVERFVPFLQSDKDIKFLDVACGNGSVTKIMKRLSEDDSYLTPNLSQKSKASVYCLDYSIAAINNLKNTEHGINALSGNACKLPFESNKFDLVVSQFGIEYAGEIAFKEAKRVLSNGGQFIGLIHMKNSAIYKECKNNYDYLIEIEKTNFIHIAKETFLTAYAVKYSGGDVRKFEQADRDLSVVVNQVKTILNRKDEIDAHNVILKIYRDIAAMYQQIEDYAPEAILNWFKNIEQELWAYKNRMASMLESAVDKEFLSELFSQEEIDSLLVMPLSNPDSNDSLAWIYSFKNVAVK